MKYDSDTLIINYESMMLGGIETYLINLIREAKKNNIRIIWLTNRERKVDVGFERDMYDGYIEIVEKEKGPFGYIPVINFYDGEVCTVLSFFAYKFWAMEELKALYPKVKFKSIFWVPHFKGTQIFPDMSGFSVIRKITSPIIRDMVIKADEAGAIYYQACDHLKAFEEHYGYQVVNPEQKYQESPAKSKVNYDEKIIRKRYYRDEKTILTVGRFDFPHKAYILGVIEMFDELKEQYDGLKLVIIGYGQGEKCVREKINTCSEKAKKDINVIGKVDFDQLQNYYQDAYIYVGVASTIIEAANCATIALPLRHYTMECETYGYLPASKYKTVSDECGEGLKKYIIEIMQMNEEEYCNQCKNAYNTYKNCSVLDILNLKCDTQKILSKREKCFIKCYHTYVNVGCKIKMKLKGKLS